MCPRNKCRGVWNTYKSSSISRLCEQNPPHLPSLLIPTMRDGSGNLPRVMSDAACRMGSCIGIALFSLCVSGRRGPVSAAELTRKHTLPMTPSLPLRECYPHSLKLFSLIFPQASHRSPVGAIGICYSSSAWPRFAICRYLYMKNTNNA